MNLFDRLLAIIAPHDCVGCTQEGALLCPRCAAKLPGATSGRMQSGGTIFARTTYTEYAKTLIWKLKSGSARAAATEIANLLPRCQRGIVVPVPTASSRVRQRGYDQALLIARAYAKRTGLPYAKHLIRQTQTRQVGASKQRRAQQLKDAFRVINERALQGQSIILIDDVSTTGATLDSAAQCLLAAGARRVDAVVLARVT